MGIEVLRRYRPDSGGLDVWVRVDGVRDDTPIHFHDGVEVQAVIEDVVTQQAAARATERKLELIGIAEERASNKMAELFESAREAVAAHPDLTKEQLKSAFVNQLKVWVQNWTGD